MYIGRYTCFRVLHCAVLCQSQLLMGCSGFMPKWNHIFEKNLYPHTPMTLYSDLYVPSIKDRIALNRGTGRALPLQPISP